MKFDWKHILLTISTVLGLVGTVLHFVPQAAPAAPIVVQLAQATHQLADGMMGPCSDFTCVRDPKTGQAAVLGEIAPLDGGAHCICK